MIINDGNRYKSIKTDGEIISGFEHDYNSLSESEREIFKLMLDDLKLRGNSVIGSVASKLQYVRPVVDIETFLKDPYYLGDIGQSLFPVWRETIVDIFRGNYEEVILGGSLGAGKTQVAVIIFARLLYEISCLLDPHKTYGISPSDFITFPVVAVTEQAAGEAFGRLGELLKSSKYFQDSFKPKITESHGMIFPKKIMVPPPGSNVQSFIGMNAFSAIIDESNFFKKITSGPVVKDYIRDVFESIKRRIENRFMRNGRVPGMLIMVSSKADPDAFTEKRILECMNDPKVFVVEKASYEVQPKERYSGRVFRVAIGNDLFQSRILGETEQVPENMQIVTVPEEYRQSFERDVDKSLREIAGVATVAVTPFIHNRSKIVRAVDPTRNHPANHVRWDQTYALDINWNMICRKNSENVWEPILNPHRPRFVHFDLSKKKDSTGFAIGHVNGFKSVYRSGSDEPENLPDYVIDFMLKVVPPVSGKEIIYSEIRKVIYQFRNHGFFIKKATSDQYQSASILEPLAQQGIETKLLSVDRLGPYDLFKSALYDERVHYYHYDPLLGELRKLQKNWKTGKVDHPEHGEKDVSDAVCGVVASLSDSAVHQVPFSGQEIAQSDNINDESWILESAIPVEKNNVNNDTTQWKQEAEASKSQKFVMPFFMG